jgi:hypothetical protein
MRCSRLGVLLLLVGCGGGTTNPPVSRCDGVRCTGSDICDPLTGACVPVARDGSVVDAGLDAGRADAGAHDAGAADAGADAGVDAGLPGDGGQRDGGADGSVADGGLDAGVPECVDQFDCIGVRNRCDLTRGRCVECLEDSHCPSAIPKCDVVMNTCVECLSNVDCANPRPTCRAKVCDDCLALGECGVGRICDLRFGDCLNLSDSCVGAQRLSLPDAGGSTFLTTELATAVDDVSTSCGSGADLVYQLEDRKSVV